MSALPLAGRCVLVTRPREQAEDMVQQLEQQGARVLVLPTVEIRDPPDWTAVDAALTHLERFDWLVFTSANGVAAVMRRLGQLGRDPQVLRSLHLAAVGPATANALRRHQLVPDVVPEVYDAEHLAAALRSRVVGQSVLLALADRSREVLRAQLGEVASVEQVTVYSQVDAELSGPVLDQLAGGGIDFITLTSSNVARALIQRLDAAALERLRSGAVRLVTISAGPSAAVREMGLPVAAEAREATTAGVVAALVRLASGA